LNDVAVPWGCHVLTTDLILSGLTPLIGKSVFSFVEFAKCGQADTLKAAIRFKKNNNPDKRSELIHNAIHSAGAAGIELEDSSNI